MMIHRTLLSIYIYTISSLTLAGITIDGTRIIFPSNAKSTNVQLRNTFNTPALAQVWIDNGDINEIPNNTEIPFILSPSLTRIEPQKGQIIRIIPLQTSTLPQDRESLYWFNLLDIPPENNQFEKVNKIDFTVRTRIKLFYRPTKLKIQPMAAYEALLFSPITNKQIEINNPSPYYITITQIQGTNKKQDILDDSIILKPYEKKLITTKHHLDSPQIVYTLINDIGVPQEFISKYPTYK
ncbi:molecular chaperone [Acinetobacter sp. ANC 4558]|uniref:fimbrial biogenesis chaperone n=1 Tax=Acinetobacter sp. ANC 4558 TaxID=1977876 RepID=UPI001D17B6FC|nr:molecular chaperone [Acinetobacter sp. ANC 4558]